MAEQQEAKRQKVKIKNGSRTGPRVIIDADLQQHYLAPGQEAEVELPEPQAKRLKDVAQKGGGDLIIDGVDPADARREGKPEQPPEHANRPALAKKEAELMKAGQEAGKEQADKDAARSNEERAAESGILAHAFGPGALETVTAPPDAPAEAPAKPSSAGKTPPRAQPAPHGS
jgi:hypothetical protein